MGKAVLYCKKYRIQVTRFLALSLFLLIAFSHHSWERNSLTDAAVESVGYVLIGIATLGRLWASAYIAGRKTEALVTEGPYSMVRHPLYLFSFIGALGIGLASENVVALAIILFAFLVYYPLVVLGEESDLESVHGATYRNYAQRTPRFFPDFSAFREPETYSVNVRFFRKTFFDAMWFFWFFIILQILERFRDIGLLPVFFRIP